MTCTDKAFAAEMGKRLADARARSGMTLSDLSGHAGVSRSHLCDVERGRQMPSAWTVARLAEVYGLSLDYLMLGNNGPTGPGEETTT